MDNHRYAGPISFQIQHAMVIIFVVLSHIEAMQACPKEVDNLSSLSLNFISTAGITITTNKHHTMDASSRSETTRGLSTSSSCNINNKAPSGDPCWDAIWRARADKAGLTMSDFEFIRQLGSGDIGSVYLVELKRAKGCVFAAKVMDKEELVNRNKQGRARMEREILRTLDHPFLPTLYATLDSNRWSLSLTEFCPGGDLHVLRQLQPHKRFGESAARLYAAEVVVALEYLHMKGIIYRDLKPENVLVKADGHIMLTDFDLSLKSDDSSSPAHIVYDRTANITSNSYPMDLSKASCIIPNCMVPVVSCFHPKQKRHGNKSRRQGHDHYWNQQVVAEPINARSMSFVGTHEYLAPEIVSGDGHGNAVDWWTLGIFVFEMFYGVTPFKGKDNESTLRNIVAHGLEFPKEPSIPGHAKDLMAQLLTKDPSIRLGCTMGATAIKHHPFFSGVNWALLRCITPPFIPQPLSYHQLLAMDNNRPDNTSVAFY